MTNSKPVIKQGIFKSIVYQKQINSYGLESAKKNLDCVMKILSSSIIQYNDNTKKNNALLVGKVQSGKTSNLEILTALAFDNGFNFLVIYGGYDKELLEQCYDRFSKTFNCYSDEEKNIPYIFNTNQDLNFLNDSFIDNAIEDNRPIMIVSLKRNPALDNVNKCLEKLDRTKIKAFIIDDEGDQASLNTDQDNFGYDEENEIRLGSSTYKSICKMKDILNNPLYFAVTATPEANIFQPEISELMPETVHLIKPANLYTGSDVFHLKDNKRINVISNLDIENIENGIFCDSLKNSINYYIIASAIMRDKNYNSTEMIIHAYREKEAHTGLYEIINAYLEDLRITIKNGIQEDIQSYFDDMKMIYNNEYFDEEILLEYPWDKSLENKIKIVINKNIMAIKQNSEGKIDKNVLRHHKHKIFIGGDLLQRGITFKHLICTYFTRWAKKGNMDTNLQRARWFGYRSDYLNLCKVFTTKEIKTEFENLSSIENDLWSQFAMIENNEMKLSDIVIDANDSNLNPTRGNVASFRKTKFSKLWNNQMYITMDINQITKNNLNLENLCPKNIALPSTSSGRVDGKISAYYLMIQTTDFLDFISKCEFIFDKPPFNGIKSLKTAFNEYDEICLEFMFGDELLFERRRSFNGNKISALQQGADTIDESKRKYKGDAYVIHNLNVPCIQVFNIVPEFDGMLNYDYKQYMYSIHFPIKHNVFIKK